MVGHVVKRDHSLPEFFNRMDSDLQAILKKYFLPFLIVHRYSGCYLPSSSKEDTSNATYYCRIIFISTVVILASYQFLQVGIYLLTIREYNSSVPVIIALFAWSFQSLASLIFLLIWQRKRTFERLFRVLHEPQKSAGILQSTFAIRVVAVVAFLLALLSILLIAASLLQCAGLYDATLPTELFNVYGEKLQFLSIIIIGYTSLFWIISLSVYVNVTICGKQEFEYFNNRLRKLGGLSRNDIFDALMDCFMTHRELANTVREMDRAFQVLDSQGLVMGNSK